jgi:hypothetical protein
VQAAFVFPIEGLHRTPETVGQRLGHIAATVHEHYPGEVVQFWVGLPLLAVLAAVRRAWVVLAPLLVIAAFSALDFQGYPDVYPLLPYAALGLAGAVALAARVRALQVVAAAALVVVVATSWTRFAGDDALGAQRAAATEIERLLLPGDTVYALGDPTPLVLIDRGNPSRYIYLSSGVGAWQIARTPGGFDGWMADIRAARPAVIVLHGWRGELQQRVAAWLHTAYRPAWVGCWRVFLRPDVAVRAAPYDSHPCGWSSPVAPDRSGPSLRVRSRARATTS